MPLASLWAFGLSFLKKQKETSEWNLKKNNARKSARCDGHSLISSNPSSRLSSVWRRHEEEHYSLIVETVDCNHRRVTLSHYITLHINTLYIYIYICLYPASSACLISSESLTSRHKHARVGPWWEAVSDLGHEWKAGSTGSAGSTSRANMSRMVTSH